MLHHVTSHHVATCFLTSRHVVSHHNMSRHVASRYVASSHISLHQVKSRQSFSPTRDICRDVKRRRAVTPSRRRASHAPKQTRIIGGGGDIVLDSGGAPKRACVQYSARRYLALSRSPRRACARMPTRARQLYRACARTCASVRTRERDHEAQVDITNIPQTSASSFAFRRDCLRIETIPSVFTCFNTVEPRSKVPVNKAMFAYKAFEKNPLIIFCNTFYIGSKALSL